MRYRAEIDGLRAIAIGAVLLFHANIGMTGGYVGVDVFFVISGFLITGLIVKDLDANRFSIIEFWERRIRRILPALAVVIFASIIAGWFLFIPAGYKQFGQSVFAQAMLVSNLYFWKQSGYFEPGAELRPLFHTWSLAVEEQFYLFFPLLLILLKRFSFKRPLVPIVTLAGLSFALSVYCSYKHELANFYFLPMRAWELLLGALLAVLPAQQRSNRWINESLSVAGLLMILFACVFYDRDTRFPGASALLPCVGTALLIWSNGHSLTSLGKTLATKPVVFLGLISYSLYLWHWPVLVFYGYWALNPVTLTQRMMLLCISVGLAILSWKFVETPFRKRQVLKNRPKVFAFACAIAIILLSSGFAISHTQGMPSRLSKEALQYANAIHDRAFLIDLDLNQVQQEEFIELGNGDKTKPISLFVWGDSHAMAAMPAIDALCRDHFVRGQAATHASQIPFLGYESRSEGALNADSIPWNDAVVSYIRSKHIKDVILICSWIGSMDFDHGTGRLRKGMLDTIPVLRECGCRVWIMKTVPRHSWVVPAALVSAALSGQNPELLGTPLAEHRMKSGWVETIFENISAPDVTLLDPTDLYVSPTGLCRVAQDGYALYCDKHHLTIHGAMLLKPLFEPVFKSIIVSHAPSTTHLLPSGT